MLKIYSTGSNSDLLIAIQFEIARSFDKLLEYVPLVKKNTELRDTQFKLLYQNYWKVTWAIYFKIAV